MLWWCFPRGGTPAGLAWAFWAVSLLWPLPVGLGLGDRTPAVQEGRAPESSIDRQLQECVDRDRTTAGMLRCSIEAEQAWEREVQRAYEALLQELDEPGRRGLQEAQQAWVAFRGAEVVWLSRLFNIPVGSMYPVLKAGDRIGLVEERALRLQSYQVSLRLGGGPPGRVQPREEEGSESPIDRRLQACIERDPTTANIVRCKEEALRAWDRELNRVYRALMRELDARKLGKRVCGEEEGYCWQARPEVVALARQELRSAQWAWLTYRDAEFAWISWLYGRREDPRSALAEVEERLSFVKARVQKLKWYLEILREI
mgnify:CR=1 FL=1